LTIILDHFYSWEFVLVNLAHKFPEIKFLIGYFLDFEIEERSFHILNSLSESLPVFNILQRPIFFQVFVAVVIPPTFCMLCDIDDF